MSEGNFNIEEGEGVDGGETLSGLLTDDAVDPLPVLQGEASLLRVTAAVQDRAHEAVLRGQSGGLGRQDAPLQSLAVPWIRQGRSPVHLHRFTSVPLAVHTALSLGRMQVWAIDLVGLGRVAAAVAAAVVTVIPPPVVPQVNDVSPGRGGDKHPL